MYKTMCLIWTYVSKGQITRWSKGWQQEQLGTYILIPTQGKHQQSFTTSQPNPSDTPPPPRPHVQILPSFTSWGPSLQSLRTVILFKPLNFFVRGCVVASPHAVCILMLILLPQVRLLRTRLLRISQVSLLMNKDFQETNHWASKTSGSGGGTAEGQLRDSRGRAFGLLDGAKMQVVETHSSGNGSQGFPTVRMAYYQHANYSAQQLCCLLTLN